MNYVVFVGSYASADQPGIYAFSFDDEDGTLKLLTQCDGIERPSFLALARANTLLFSVSEANGGAVWVCDLDRGSGEITPRQQQPSGGDWPCHLATDNAGSAVFVANYGSGTAARLPLATDGSLGPMSGFVQHSGSGPNADRQEGPHAHSTTLTPDGRFAVVADLGIDRLMIYAIDAHGALRFHSEAATAPGAGPRHAVFHPGGSMLYVANELDCTVSAYRYDAAAGTLNVLQILPTLPDDAPETTVADIHIGPDRRLYVSNRGHNSIAVYSIGDDGLLTLLGIPSCGGDWPRNFAVAPDGRYVLVANQYSGEVVVLPVQQEGEPLGAPVARVSVPTASCVVFAV
ncbi:lactonase family protein [Candidatus Gracilibacteria bacterium]|nr:lactonase family protein [Candidatus Gracilibacteria bacterium]